MKYEAILENSRFFKVADMCRVLGVTPQNYYRWRRNRIKAAEKKKRLLPLILSIIQLFNETRKTYGYRKMQKELKKRGIKVSTYLIRRIMRENGLYPETVKKYKPCKSNREKMKYAIDSLRQEFHVKDPGEVLAGDITYVQTNKGWVYLAVVMDLYNREVVGYETGRTIDTELVKRALSHALTKGIRPRLFHSDRGSQYSSASFKRMLEENGIQASQSRGGCPYDNACVESFFATAKKELIFRKQYDKLEDVEADIYDYIENFYNRKRLHSYLGYMSPVEYRLKRYTEDCTGTYE
ncbi:MAG: IS3 family transposase [Clostridia bacterium]|nr:IS3 family transposase [Clostridia bacterium]